MLKRFARIVAPALLLALAVNVRADDPAKAPQVFVHASIASTSRLKQAITDLGIPIPLDPAQIVEGKFSFLGDGGLDTTKPLGIVVLAGENLNPQQMMLFALPINAGKATVDNLTALGGTVVAGQPDTVDMGGNAALKRTADYLFMHPGAADLLKLMQNNPFANDYKNKETLAHIHVDMKTFRAASPDLFKTFIDGVRAKSDSDNQQAAANGADMQARKIGSQVVIDTLEKLEQLNLALNLNDKNLSLVTTFSPSPMKGLRSFPKPIFGPNTVMSANVAYPTSDATKWLATFAKLGMESDHASHADKSTPEQFAKAEPAALELANAVVADAQSVAVEGHDGHFVVTIVNQYSRDVNLPDVLKKTVPILNENMPDASKKPTILQDATGPDGFTGVTLKDTDDSAGVTVLQKGRIAVITISDQPLANAAAPRFTLSPTEKISEVLSLKVDLGATLKLVSEQKDNALASMPEDTRTALITKLAGKNLSLTVTNDALGAMTVNLDIPVDLIKAGVNAAMAQAMQ